MAKMQMLPKRICPQNANDAIKRNCCQNTNFAKTQLSPKRKFCQNTNVAKTQMLPKCKCCQNENVAKTQM